MDEIKEKLDTNMNYTGMDKHVPEAECNNHTIGERVRVRYHYLPFKTMPKGMLKYLAMVSTQQLNIFPAKRGILEYYSPHVLLGGRPYDYAKDCQVDLVHMYKQIKITISPTRTVPE